MFQGCLQSKAFKMGDGEMTNFYDKSCRGRRQGRCIQICRHSHSSRRNAAQASEFGTRLIRLRGEQVLNYLQASSVTRRHGPPQTWHTQPVLPLAVPHFISTTHHSLKSHHIQSHLKHQHT